MPTAYQYWSNGYFEGVYEDYGLLPNNATYVPTAVIDGYIPRWNGTSWDQVENHKGEEGWLNGQFHIISDYGPYPPGWSATEPPPPEPTPEEKVKNAINVIRTRLNDFAVERQYIDILDAASFAGDADPQFDAEGTYARDIRSQTWRSAYNILQDIKNGITPWPADMDAFVAMLPDLVWPIPPGDTPPPSYISPTPR